MVNNNINWLGNSVVGENSSPHTAISYPSFASQNSPAEFSAETEHEISVDPINQPGPPLVSDMGYIPGYLESKIGKNIREVRHCFYLKNAPHFWA